MWNNPELIIRQEEGVHKLYIVADNDHSGTFVGVCDTIDTSKHYWEPRAAIDCINKILSTYYVLRDILKEVTKHTHPHTHGASY